MMVEVMLGMVEVMVIDGGGDDVGDGDGDGDDDGDVDSGNGDSDGGGNNRKDLDELADVKATLASYSGRAKHRCPVWFWAQ
jgi:hypothetical protein